MIYCENIVKIMWTWQLIFLLIHRFHNFFSIFGNGIATIVKIIFFLHYRQWDCHNCQNKFFFFHIISNGNATIAKIIFFFFFHYWLWVCHNCQIIFFFLHYRQWDCHNCQTNVFFFFFRFSAMPWPQLICYNFFELIIINHVWFIVKIL